MGGIDPSYLISLGFSTESFPPDCYSVNADTRRKCLDSCTVTTCPLAQSYWGYNPSLVPNGLFIGLFGLSTLAFMLQMFLSKRYLLFSLAMIAGGILDVIGYVARIWARNHLWTEEPFLIQIVCLTIAPAFYAAGIYFCLSRIVTVFGVENSRVSAKTYPIFFITCDCISLILQCVGGGMAAASIHELQDPKKGTRIMVSGLVFQVLTLVIFMALALDFVSTTRRRIRTMGKEEALDQSHAALRKSAKFKGFLLALTFATLCIFTRCVYRVAELSQGWNGHLLYVEYLFVLLEGATIAAGVIPLNFFHPAVCFREADHNRPPASLD